MASANKPWKISALLGPAPFDTTAAADAGFVPAQVTDSFDLVRRALGHNAPYSLGAAREKALAFRDTVK